MPQIMSENTIIYPEIRRDESIVDNYHGAKIQDPYSWLEDPDSEDTKTFVETQNKVTLPYIKECSVNEKFHNRVKELWDYPKYGCPFKRGSRYFYFYNSGLQNQSVLYVQESLESEAEVFLDPNKLSEDGTVAIRGYEFSEDGEYFAVGLSDSGSDWVTIKFLKVTTKEFLEDVLKRVKFTCLSWTHDHKGLFYNKFPDSDGKQDGTETSINLHQKLNYHVIGTPQSEDILCAEFLEHPKWMVGAEVSDDGRYVIISIREGCAPVNRLYYVDLENVDSKISGLLPYVKIVDNFDAEYEYVTNEKTVFTFKTNSKAPKYKLINIDLQKPEPENWTTLIAERDNDVLEWAACVNNDILVLCYLHDVKNKLYLHNLSSGERLRELALEVGTVTGYSGRKKDLEIFYRFSSFLTPGVIYHFNLAEQETSPKVFKEIEVKGFDHTKYTADQVFYCSKDGTKIPMFIVHKKGIKLDGSHPCLLYGYGGFSISIMPSFSVSRVIFMQHLGGIVAIANIRGGAEYGEEWHEAGTLERKQNVFDDFQAAAEYLAENNYTSSERLTIQGGSNGGLLVGACVNQRPDLFKCAIVQVGVMDMLKFHKFTIGHAWTTDFGCADKEEDYQYLIKYSPLHNIKIPEKESVQYPAMLLMTADHDDRVVPLHSFKYISELQHRIGRRKEQKNPLLIKIDTKAGHGAGKPTSKLIEEVADIYGFIARNVGAIWTD